MKLILRIGNAQILITLFYWATSPRRTRPLTSTPASLNTTSFTLIERRL
jgi:hypothetical protein